MLKRLYRLYRCIATSILQFFNFNELKNPNGTNHPILNAIDFSLAFSYAAISLYKLDTVTFVILIINGITFGRFIILDLKLSLKIREQYKEIYSKKPGLYFKSSHDLTLLIESVIILTFFVPFIVQGAWRADNYIRGFAIAIIILGFFKNILSICIELFEADINLQKS